MKPIEALHLWEKSNSHNNNTYKYVLALAILDFVQGNRVNSSIEISYDFILEKFLHFYWNHANIYKLRHSVSENQQPKFITAVKNADMGDEVRTLYFPNLKKKHPDVVRSLMDELKNQGADRTLRNPISRFNSDYSVKDQSGGDKSGKGWLYEWNEADEKIILNPGNIEILKKNPVLFQIVTVLKCAKFLEDYNVTPHLTDKIAFEIIRTGFSDRLKHNFDLYIQLFKEDHCFYCGGDLNGYHKDHFIPWEYVLEHKIWNLVPSCPSCNNGTGGKFIRIPEKEFLEKLLQRNHRLFSIKEFNLESEFQNTANLEEAVIFLYENALKSGYSLWQR